MGAYKFYSPTTQKWEIIKSQSIIKDDGSLEYTPDDIKKLKKGTARFVIGTSTAGWTAKDCDFLCDGTADQIEINQAIQALPSNGGEIAILDGIYNIKEIIQINKNNLKLTGCGFNTVLESDISSVSIDGLIEIHSVTNCIIENLRLESIRNSLGIYSETSITGPSNIIIQNNIINNFSRGGIRIEAKGQGNIIIKNNIISNSGNSFIGGIRLEKLSNVMVSNNIIKNINGCGIELLEVSCSTVSHNVCIDNLIGVRLRDSNNNNIIGNICIRGTGAARDYAESQHTIHLASTDNNYNLVSSNNCMGKAVIIGGGTSNTEVNNKWQ